MIKKIAISMLVLACFAALPAHSQEGGYGSGRIELMTVEGKVVSVDVSASTIVIRGVNGITFFVPSDAELTKDINDIELSDINTGDYVRIGYFNDENGAHIAKTIVVEYAKEE